MFFKNSELLPRKAYAQGTVIFEEGQPGTACFLINSGWVSIYRTIDGEEINIAKLRESMLFGEMALVDGSARMASARAHTDVELTVISKQLFDKHLQKLTPFMAGVMRMVVGNLREAQRRQCELEFMLHRAGMSAHEVETPSRTG